MNARVVTVAQQKGGSGKTTVAIQLAVAWMQGGRRVAILDIDPQASVGGWQSLRAQALPEAHGPTVQLAAGWRVDAECRALARDHDPVVIDSPPHALTEARVAIRTADLVLVPCQPSLLDLWATRATIELARREQRPLLLVFNRVPPRGRAVEEVRAAILAEHLPLADAALGNRQAFATSLGRGLGVGEAEPASSAAREIQALALEVEARLA